MNTIFRVIGYIVIVTALLFISVILGVAAVVSVAVAWEHFN